MNMKILTIIISLTTVLTSGAIIGLTKDNINEVEGKVNSETLNMSKLSEERNEIIEQEKNQTTEEKNEKVDEFKNQDEEKVETKNQQESTTAVNTTKKTTSSTTKNEYQSTNNKDKVYTNIEKQITMVDENASTGNEGMKNKYECTGIITIKEHNFVPNIGGYAISYKYMTVDLMRKTAKLVDHYEIMESIWNGLSEEEKKEEGSRVQEDVKEIKLSDDECEKIYNTYMKITENFESYNMYSLEKYTDDMFVKQNLGIWDESNGIYDEYYYTFDGTYMNEKLAVFDNARDVSFINQLFNK